MAALEAAAMIPTVRAGISELKSLHPLQQEAIAEGFQSHYDKENAKARAEGFQSRYDKENAQARAEGFQSRYDKEKQSRR